MAFLELRDVFKSYETKGARTPVLEGVNLEIEKGEFVAIVGRSGAGKTTLISLIAGLIRPDRGTVILDGREVLAPGPDRGVVFQNYSLLPWLTVHENIALAVDQLFGEWTPMERRAHVEKFIELVGLGAARGKRPRELSGGMRQRVSLARALAMDPQILLLDEPLSALDALTRSTLQDELERIWSLDRKTVVLITNDVDEGILLADRIVPLGGEPGAALGPSVEVDIPRPRNRKALHHDARFKELRLEVAERLLRSRVAAAPVARELAPADKVDDYQPLDLSCRQRRWLSGGPRLKRVHAENVEVAS